MCSVELKFSVYGLELSVVSMHYHAVGVWA